MQSEDDVRRDAKEYALRRLNRRECSSQDIYRHLIKKGTPPQVASEVLSELKSLNYLNDQRFAKLLTREQSARGKGPRLIHQKLKEKGIRLNLEETKNLAEEVTETTELNMAKELVRRKYAHASPAVCKDKKETLRALQGLLRRGFSYPVAVAALACPEPEPEPDPDPESDPTQT